MLYKKVPDAIIVLSRRTREDYIRKGKITILEAWCDIVQDYYMKNKVSYNHYAKRWSWTKYKVKEFLDTIGLTIPTTKNQYENACLEKIDHQLTTKLTTIYPALSNIFNKLDNNLTTNLTTILTTNLPINNKNKNNNNKNYNNNTLKEKEKINKKKKKNKKDIFSGYEKTIFEEIWAMFREFNKKYPLLATRSGRKDKAYQEFNKLLKKHSLEKIKKYSLMYLEQSKLQNLRISQVYIFLKNLQDEGFIQDLKEFNPRMYLTLDDVDIHVRDNGIKSRLVFIYQGQELTKEEVLQLLVRKFKSQDFAIQIAQEFRTYLLNEHPNLQGSVKNLFYKFLEERRDYGYN